jgi:hypothetical protein
MPEPLELLRRQEAWQRSLRKLPWAEKLRMAARVREAVLKMRRPKTTEPTEAASGPEPADRRTEPGKARSV